MTRQTRQSSAAATASQRTTNDPTSSTRAGANARSERDRRDTSESSPPPTPTEHHLEKVHEGSLCLLDLEKLARSDILPYPPPLSASSHNSKNLLMNNLMPIVLGVEKDTVAWDELRKSLTSIWGAKRVEWPEKMVSSLGKGWAGIDVVIKAFRMLEEVESEAEATQALAWLEEFVVACCRLGYHTNRDKARPVISSLLSDAGSRPLVPLRSNFRAEAPVPATATVTHAHSNATHSKAVPAHPPQGFSEPNSATKKKKRLAQSHFVFHATGRPAGGGVPLPLTPMEHNASFQAAIGPLSSANIQSIIEARSRMVTEAEAKSYAGLPPYSWAGMAAQALLWSNNGSCTESQICDWLRTVYRGLALANRDSQRSWEKAVRDTLPVYPAFVHINPAKLMGNDGKLTEPEPGVTYWALDAQIGKLGEESLKADTGNLISSSERWKAMADLAERIVACSAVSNAPPPPTTQQPPSSANHHPSQNGIENGGPSTQVSSGTRVQTPSIPSHRPSQPQLATSSSLDQQQFGSAQKKRKLSQGSMDDWSSRSTSPRGGMS